MYTVKKKPLTSNMLWDAENEKPLCRFVKGILETNDEALVAKLQADGYEVSGEADADNGEGQTTEPDADPSADSNDDAEGDAEPTSTPDTTGEADAAATTTTGAKRRSRK